MDVVLFCHSRHVKPTNAQVLYATQNKL